MKNALRGLPILALASLTALSGCLQFEQSSTLFQDGSGKIQMKVALKKSMLKMMEEFAKSFGGGEAPDMTSQFSDPQKLMENSEGIVAWTAPRKEEDADWVRFTSTGYFEDVNKVKIYNVSQGQGGQTERKLTFSAKLEKTDAGHVLTMENDTDESIQQLPGGGADANPELTKAVLAAMKPMFEGMKMGFSFTVPGPITEAPKTLDRKDRTASFSLDGAMILAAVEKPDGDEAKKLKALGEQKSSRIVWKENTVSADELAAFKKELGEAKDNWKKVLEDAKKK